MITFLSIFFAFSFKAFSQEESVNKNVLLKWNRLIQVDNEINYDKSTSFYTTSSTDASSELEGFKKLLQGNNALYYACQFPSRYNFLLKNELIKVKVDLNNCKNLSFFKQKLNKKYISLVFSSEYINSPASAFGHTMLVFHNNKVTPEPSSLAIHFAADASSSLKGMGYIIKGISGGFIGRYYITPFFEKVNEYLHREQRFLYSYQLDINEYQKDFLINHLYELQQASFNYFFFNKNCSYQLENLLSMTFNEKMHKNFFYTFPINTVYRNKHIQESPTVLTPYSFRARKEIESLSNNERKDFEEIINGKKILLANHTEDLKRATFYYYKYNFRKNRTVLPNYKTNMLIRRNKPQELKSDLPNPLKRNRPSYSGAEVSSTDSTRFLLSPALIDIHTPQFGKYYESELKFFDFIFLKENSENKVEIEKADILQIKLLSENNRYFRSSSWGMYIGFNKENPDDNLSFDTYFGMGTTTSQAIKSNFMLNFGFNQHQSQAKLFLMPELNFYTYLNKNVKIMFQNFVKQFKDDKYIANELSAIKFLNSHFEVSLKLGHRTNQKDFVSLTTKYFF